MTFAGFFVHLASIPPVLRWLQWFCPLKVCRYAQFDVVHLSYWLQYCLEALSVNEVGSGLMVSDQVQGVPITISGIVLMEMVMA